MTQSIKLDDDLYQRIKDLADREFRTVPLQIKCMVERWDELVLEEKKIAHKEKKEVEPSGGQKKSSGFVEVQPEQKSQEVSELIRKMNELKFKLREDQLIQWCQKIAVKEYWTEEEAKIQTDNHRSELEEELELVTERMNELGMCML